jgi:hypothetical protein
VDILAQIIEVETTVDGQLPSGFLFASIKNIGNAIATVNGVSLTIGQAVSYPFIGKGYATIAYQVNGSTLRIMRVV